jgi:hypothetical protein
MSIPDKLTVSKIVQSLNGYFPKAQIFVFVKPEDSAAIVGVANLKQEILDCFNGALSSIG